MPYGIEIRTSTGMQDISQLAYGARLIQVVECRSVEGSASIPNWNSPSDAANFYVVNNSTRPRMPYVEWNNSTKTLSWGKYVDTQDAAWSDNFDVYLWS